MVVCTSKNVEAIYIATVNEQFEMTGKAFF
jgi:hypothetical protein